MPGQGLDCWNGEMVKWFPFSPFPAATQIDQGMGVKGVKKPIDIGLW